MTKIQFTGTATQPHRNRKFRNLIMTSTVTNCQIMQMIYRSIDLHNQTGTYLIIRGPKSPRGVVAMMSTVEPPVDYIVDMVVAQARDLAPLGNPHGCITHTAIPVIAAIPPTSTVMRIIKLNLFPVPVRYR